MLTPLSKDSNATVSSERDSRNLPTGAFIARYNRELARWATVCRSARSSARHFILEKILSLPFVVRILFVVYATVYNFSFL